MSWQGDRAVPSLAGEAFCEKPPAAYWAAGATIAVLGPAAWAARLPNLLYAIIAALAVGAVGRRCAGPLAELAAAAAMGTLLLSYQVAIWLATDAPLSATVAVALLGLYRGFYADTGTERIAGYTCMHAALAVGFLEKSAAAWMVPALTLLSLILWERRFRELLHWELYAGLALQAIVILTWVWAVYVSVDGPAHLKVFFWNNLVGRFTHVEAPPDLQYAAAHRNFPGKYLLELPLYLWPWTLLFLAAARRAWLARRLGVEGLRPVRFAVAIFVPTLAVLSVAATARNIYLAPALPGAALLLGWWTQGLASGADRWDVRAVRGTAWLLLVASALLAAVTLAVGADAWDTLTSPTVFVTVTCLGLACGAGCAFAAWRAAGRGLMLRGLLALLLAYGGLLVGPASQIYRRVDAWQDLASIGRALRRDATGRPIILFAPDETTRAFVDMYTQRAVEWIPGPVETASLGRLQADLRSDTRSVVLALVPGRASSRTFRQLAARWRPAQHADGLAQPDDEQPPSWAGPLGLRIIHRYALPNGRRYALLAPDDAAAPR